LKRRRLASRIEGIHRQGGEPPNINALYTRQPLRVRNCSISRYRAHYARLECGERKRSLQCRVCINVSWLTISQLILAPIKAGESNLCHGGGGKGGGNCWVVFSDASLSAKTKSVLLMYPPNINSPV
jgi:hypothetical protein